MNFLDAEIETVAPWRTVLRLASGDTITAAIDARSAHPGQRMTLGVRPEHFDAQARSNALPLQVRFVERLGSVTVAYGTVARTETEVTLQLAGDLKVSPGETIRPGVAPHACYLFDADGHALRRAPEPAEQAAGIAVPSGLG
jgi:multiple sugar transport system ATP-binding protein